MPLRVPKPLPVIKIRGRNHKWSVKQHFSAPPGRLCIYLSRLVAGTSPNLGEGEEEFERGKLIPRKHQICNRFHMRCRVYRDELTFPAVNRSLLRVVGIASAACCPSSSLLFTKPLRQKRSANPSTPSPFATL